MDQKPNHAVRRLPKSSFIEIKFATKQRRYLKQLAAIEEGITVPEYIRTLVRRAIRKAINDGVIEEI